MNVVVVGSGVIGLSCARALAQAGHCASVIDGGSRGREASLAAAGILGAGSEHDVDSALFRISLDALRAWPESIACLGRDSRREIVAHWDGTLLVARNEAEHEALARREAFHRKAGLPSRLLTADGARVRERRLSPGVVAALHVPEGRVDPATLHAGYAAACERLGVAVHTGADATDLITEGDRVAGVRVGGRALEADAVVVAAGAWSEALARTTGVALPSEPIKGQLVRVEAPDGHLTHVVKRRSAYAVPQARRGIVLGTTSESVGFDRSTSDEVVANVRRAAEELVVGLGSLPVLETWIGFRPRLADGLPAIGPVRGCEGLFLATGHHRNGILLCDLTGRLIARAVAGDVDPRLAAFSPDRFATGTPAS